MYIAHISTVRVLKTLFTNCHGTVIIMNGTLLNTTMIIITDLNQSVKYL